MISILLFRDFRLHAVGSAFLLVCVALTAAGSQPDAGDQAEKSVGISLRERIEAWRRIERVNYEHRIWPKENPQPKPSFEEMVPGPVIERKARDPLLKTHALKHFWNVEITPAMLQAELDRMARDSKAPATLRELFTALDNDPRLIAEVLARDHLTDLLIRERYARDPALHTAARRRAEMIRETTGKEDWRKLAAREGLAYSRTAASPEGDELQYDQAEFAWKGMMHLPREEIALLRRRFIEYAVLLQERGNGFEIQRALSTAADQLEIETIFVPKYNFDLWWKQVGEMAAAALPFAASDYHLPNITNTVGCDQWTPTSTGAGVPSSRSGQTAVWTGAEMVIWGSSNTGDVTGGRYYPTTDSWMPTSTGAGVPPSAEYLTSVWTGKEMIVWGGYNGLSAMNTGSRYNPATNSWNPVTMTGVPLPRYNHTAIWTGSDMIIWGGNSGISTYNTGGRYNPNSNTWLPTDPWSSYTPEARFSHSAVWTGAEMIIWGGYGGGAYRTDGSFYNPVTDGWRPMLQTGYVPIGRTSHTVVWTGSEMIIWGGDYQFIMPYYYPTATGGKYDPLLARWVATSMIAGVPSARSQHTAVWTGNEMIVWGGIDRSPSGGYSNSGGRFYHDIGNWFPTSFGANVPTPRNLHSAVWTGTSMIIWGGSNTGGVYTSGAAPSPANTLRSTKSSTINLTWSWITGAGSYNVKRCEPTTGPCTPATIVSTPTIPQYSEPDDGQSHFYAIEAVNQCGATP